MILMDPSLFLVDLDFVAQVSQPAVSPISKSAGRTTSFWARAWKPATQQTRKSALLQQLLVLTGFDQV
jgi:hypothetical protein